MGADALQLTPTKTFHDRSTKDREGRCPCPDYARGHRLDRRLRQGRRSGTRRGHRNICCTLGWGGTGAEDPVTYEPILPPGVTFADVLAGVDRMVFTTLQPGFFYGFTDFDLRIDNITAIREAPDPADLDGNGSVGPSDLAILLGAWGSCPPKGSCTADLDGDGSVGPGDLTALLAAWG